MVDEPKLEHIPYARTDWHEKWGVTYCRRCGRVLVKDRDPDFVQAKPCEVIRIGLRGH